MYRKKNAPMLHLAEEMAQKMQSGYVQPWEPSESSGRMPAPGNAVHVSGWVGHWCLEGQPVLCRSTLSSLCE